MDTRKTSKRLIFAGGIIELAIAILHFSWPFDFVLLPEIKNTPAPVKDLMILSTLAVGLCLTTFACLSFYFSTKTAPGNKTVVIFCLSQGIMWILRLFFELQFPVSIPIYFIKNPSIFIVAGTNLIIAIYLIPVYLLHKSNTR